MNGFVEVGRFVSQLGADLKILASSNLGAYVLALTFLIAGISKVRRPHLTAFAIVDFRVTRSPLRGAGLTLGWTEIALASMLVLGSTRSFALMFAAVQLWIFVALMLLRLSAGDSFPCYCFGGASSLSLRSTVRTAFLALLATVALYGAPSNEEQVDALALAGAGALVGSTSLVGALRQLRTVRANEPGVLPSLTPTS